MRPSVLVVGCGVVGAALAWRLAERGAAVTVAEARDPGAATSATSFGWVNASSKLDYDPDYFELNRRAVEEHRRIARSWHCAPWFHGAGNLELGNEAELAAKVTRLRERGYRAELLAATRLRELEPGLRAEVAAYYPDEAWVDVPAMVAATLALAEAAGAELRPRCEITELQLDGGALIRARTAAGEVLYADTVAVAAGGATPALLARLGAEAPLVDPDAPASRAIGLLATVHPRTAGPQRMLQSPEVNWVPQPGGRLMLASTAADHAVAEDATLAARWAAAEALVAHAGDLHSTLAGAQIEAARVGRRVLPVDDHAICGWVSDAQPDRSAGVYAVATHSGVTLAPLLATLAADEILDGTVASQLERFRPARFAANAR